MVALSTPGFSEAAKWLRAAGSCYCYIGPGRDWSCLLATRRDIQKWYDVVDDSQRFILAQKIDEGASNHSKNARV